jgi:hypothetical protein
LGRGKWLRIDTLGRLECGGSPPCRTMSWGDGGGKRARPRLEFSLWLICSYFGLGGDAVLAEAFDLGLADVGDA